ncbi:putative haemolysin-III related [Lyophyllum shimeji]|uniref:Haemolysin-III related n=1 Tax=Lyophyllum shimeji TaxID=47721 RepID=A0A9P3PK99_LYOSH|nr:putative haemolysin-III related [Lyophyllum shimeji]
MSTVTTTARASPTSEIHRRRVKRRLSTPSRSQPARLPLCHTLPLSLEALDLSSASPTQTLASLRFLVLSYLADLERRLSNLESPDLEAWKAMGELTIEDARQWASTALEMLGRIRADVCSHLPEFHFTDTSMEDFVKSHLPDLPDVPGFTEMRAHLPDISDVRSHFPDMPNLPDMPNVRSRFSDMRVRLDDVRSRFNDLDFKKPLSYIPTLSKHLETLHSHLSSTELPSPLDMSGAAPSAVISDLLEALLNSELVGDILNANPTEIVEETEDMLHRAANEVANAVKRSFQGVRLIQYADLPQQWRNNPFVTHGYRFIPLERWPLIIMSLFAFHNETLNIHTHLIPFLLWGINSLPFLNPNFVIDTPERLFMCFALLCLFSSAVWHTMSGCADQKSMDLCARIDYVGIGWLISASVGTVVYYGFRCYPSLGQVFLGVCFLTGLAGNVFPFMEWFNMHEYRFYRIAFFVSLAFSAIAPLAGLGFVHSWKEMFSFIAPIIPSLLSYTIGLLFYALHFPERIIPPSIQRRLDVIGGNSHCIWHCFIVLAVSQHRAAIASFREGVQCLAKS